MIILLFFFGILMGCTTTPSKDEIRRYEAEAGYQVYLSCQCAKCHGVYGQGMFSQRSLTEAPRRAAAVVGKVRREGSDKLPVYQRFRSEENRVYFISDADPERPAPCY